MELALRGGGPDNITCIVADVVDVAARATTCRSSAARSTDRAATTDSGSNSRRPGRPGCRSPSRSSRRCRAAHRGRRRWLVAGLAALLVLAAAVGGYLWTQKQYFVGRDGDEVAVFRGVNAHFGPVSLYSVIENTDLRIADLTQSAGGQVLNGITANSRADADAILARLADELKPPCPSPPRPRHADRVGQPTATPSVSRTAGAHPDPVGQPAGAPSPAPRPSRGSGRRRPPRRPPTPLPSPSNTPVPGVDCR